MELMWSVQYHNKIILTMGPLLNNMAIKGGVIYYVSFYIIDEYKDTSGKDSFTEFSGITVAILQSQLLKFYPMGRHTCIFIDLKLHSL